MQDEQVAISDALKSRLLQHSPLGPLPPDPTNRIADDPAAARLGQFLFFDPRLSRDGKVSWATCHDPKQSFSDGKPLGKGTVVNNSTDFCAALLEEAHVALVSGDAFGAPGYVRLSFATSLKVLETGCDRLAAFLGA